ncbi:NAD(P)H pyrophosphatase NUDT13, mitochondrial [Pseudolycoriella hygida]|uniref:NAD(+) diphosphatase n=1 Tax=Pseudolycoriella hygida TaxID=35572 RepID=A0A9Q0S1P6_9DIPT|nr:NAD(P)H pyrophosphatase NUDT13, mitochondrial [Pseudolycoriella hygida]KAJ6642385.1 NAD(P)H pyrophosphatase NUDT13, mitochondrial [Pseudolycoriella hygida]
MSWSLSRMSRYVFQSKYLQQLKENDELCADVFEKSCYLMFAKDRPLLGASSNVASESAVLWTPFSETIPYCQDLKNTSVLLTIDESTEDTPLFACRIDDPSKADEIGDKFNANFTDMRMAIFTLPEEQCNIISRAFTLLNWNQKTNFCSNCASPLRRNVSGTLRACTKPCDPRKANIYPPTFPVAITRVTDQKDEKVLLVRQPQYPRGMYTCISGFMEAGETLEDSVRREIAEEAGIVIENVKYFQSQSWPLPQNSLMLGCTAVAMPGSEKLDIDKHELEMARWFSKAEVKAALERIKENPGLLIRNSTENLIVPPSGAVAHQLLQNWISNYSPSHL